MNLGGLFRALTFVGGVLTGWYSSFNGLSSILNMLYVESSPKYHELRAKQGDVEGVQQIFKNFSERKPVTRPTLLETFRGWLFRSPQYKRNKRIRARGQSLIKSQLDVLKFIRMNRFSQVAFKGIFADYQAKFVGKCSEKILSEWSTDPEDTEDHDNDPKNGDGINCIAEMKDSDLEWDKRIINNYQNLEDKRNSKWAIKHPESLKRIAVERAMM